MSTETESTDTALGVVFPGQGSQSVGMLGELAAAFPLVSETFREASDVLGYDLWQLVSAGPAESLNQTDRTAPAMLAAGTAVWRVWQAQGGAAPALMAGHSLGEYTALVCSGAIDFADAVSLVAERGRCMQSAVPAGTGSMAAILGLDDDAVAGVCAKAAGEEVVSPANFNSPGQVVVAGHATAVHRAVELAREAGAKRAVELSVSVPSHCELMKPAAEALVGKLGEVRISEPDIPVIQNVDATAHTDPNTIRANLEKQLYMPVRWVASIETMKQQGITRIIEAGPGKVLTGLCKRIDRSIDGVAVFDPDTLASALN